LKFNLLFFVRLFLRHLHLLIIVPVLLAGLVFYLTQDEAKSYYSTVKIYTGIASGASIELDNQRFDYRAANTAFDNLINIVESKRTLSEVGLRLFSQHMTLTEPDPMIIGREKYYALMRIVPEEVKALAKPGDYAGNLQRFREYMNQGTENFLHELINLRHPDYSYEKIGAKIWVKRLSNSDFIELGYETEDPGICQNTLRILVEVFTVFNTEIKVNNTDEVVKYFQAQLQHTAEELRIAEGNMQAFNKTHNIINYYEQTKHIASQREHTELEYQNVLTNYHGAKAILKNLESRMELRQKQRLTSQAVLETRDEIAEANFQIAMLEITPPADSLKRENNAQRIYQLRLRADSLERKLGAVIDTLYRADIDQNGLPSTSILDNWLNTVMEVERKEAQIKVFEEKREEFEELYATFSPLGAEMKRLERKIDVAEREYLSILHSLGLAKLKQQSIEMKSNYTVAEPAYYPLIPKPSKRKILIAAAGVMGFALTAFTILLLEFLDTNIKDARRAEKKIGLPVTAIYPKLVRRSRRIDVDYLQDRATDAILLNVAFADREKEANPEAPSVNFFISTQKNDGKTFIGHRLLNKLAGMGYRTLFLTPENKEYSMEEGTYDHRQFTSGSKLYAKERLSELNPDLSPEQLSTYDFIFVEAPPIISKAFPVKLFHEADHVYLVVRANRPWSDADKNAMKVFREIAPEPEPSVILNGVELLEMESVLGDLPRRRTWVRRFIKNALRLRFFSKRKL
jgi:succinoglycan biosynthesis transport protein ExoP